MVKIRSANLFIFYIEPRRTKPPLRNLPQKQLPQRLHQKDHSTEETRDRKYHESTRPTNTRIANNNATTHPLHLRYDGLITQTTQRNCSSQTYPQAGNYLHKTQRQDLHHRRTKRHLNVLLSRLLTTIHWRNVKESRNTTDKTLQRHQTT